jgi:hypothetical protein
MSEIGPYEGTSWQALLLHDSRFGLDAVDATLSSYTEAGAVPGRPGTANVSGYLDLEAVGSSPTAGYALAVAATKEGAAVGGNAGGRYRWKQTADSASEWRGHLNHNKVTGFEFARTGGSYLTPSAIRLPDHTVVVAYRNDSGPSIDVSTLDPTTGSWSHVTVDSGAADPQYPVLVRLPDTDVSGGRLLCYYKTELTEGGTTYDAISFAYSDDDGATWAVGGRHLDGYRRDTSTYQVIRLSAVYVSGQVTLLVEGYDTGVHTVWHYVSGGGSLGSAFDLVDTRTTAAKWAQLFTDAAGTVGLVESGVLARKKATPRSSFDTTPDTYTLATSANVDPGGSSTERSHAICIDDEGYLWSFWREETTRRFSVRCLRVDAETMSTATDRWLAPTGGAIRWPLDLGDDDDIRLTDFCAVPYKGSILIIANCSTTTGTTDDWLSVIYLGGYTSVDWREQSFGGYDTSNLYRSGMAYLPLDEPSNVSGWTVAGTGTDTLTTTGLRVQATSGAARSYSRLGPLSTVVGVNPAGRPCLAWARVQVTTGSNLVTAEHAIQLERTDGTVAYKATLRLSTTGARLYDNYGAATVGSDVTGLGADTMRDWLVSVQGSKVSTWYKAPSATLWTTGPSGTLVDGGTGTPTAGLSNSVAWGSITGPSSGTNDARWLMMLSCVDRDISTPGLTTQTNPDDLQGRAFSARPLYLSDDEGVQIQAKGSSSLVGDVWTLTDDPLYGVKNLHVEVSPAPSVAWRSTQAALDEVIAWVPNATGTGLLSSSIGVALMGVNFEASYFEGRLTGTSTWVTLLSLNSNTADLNPGTLGYTITGDWVYPSVATAAGARFVELDELVGGYVVLESSGADVVAEVLHNSAGVWRQPGTARHLELLVEGAGTISTPSSIRFIPPNVVGVVHNALSSYDAYRLRIPGGQPTREGYYKIGALVVGDVVALARRPGHPSTESMSPNATLTETSSGARRVRRDGPPRRVVEVSWPVGQDTSTLYADTPDPDYAVARTGASYRGIGLPHDATLYRGLIRRTRGGEVPVVYLPRLDLATGATTAYYYTAPSRLLYGRTLGPVTQQAVVGRVAESEVITTNALVVEEEVG